MNQKAFNLLTSLVAITLVIMAFLLITIMIEREKTTSSFVANIEKKSKVEALINLTRADALQTINFGVRKSIEEFIDDPNSNDKPNVFFLERDKWESWARLTGEFICTQFGGAESCNNTGNLERNSAFSNRLQNNIKGLFNVYGYNFGSFQISVDIEDNEDFGKIMNLLVNKSVEQCTQEESDEGRCTEGNNGLVEIITPTCEDTGLPEFCELGTFYITLRTSRLTDKEYEQLPLIKIEDLGTGTIIKDPILPRNDVRFYVPLRLFKALSLARRYAHFKLEGENGDIVTDFSTDVSSSDRSSDYGFYSPRMHNEFQSMRLGMCDYGICKARDNPYFPPAEIFDSKSACPSSGGTVNDVPINKSDLGLIEDYLPPAANLKYNPDDKKDTIEAIKEISRARLCWIADMAYSTLPAKAKDSSFLIGNELTMPKDKCKYLFLENASGVIETEKTSVKSIAIDSKNVETIGSTTSLESDSRKNRLASEVILPPNNPVTSLGGFGLEPKDWYCPFDYVNEGYYQSNMNATKWTTFFQSNPGRVPLSFSGRLMPFLPNSRGAYYENGEGVFQIQTTKGHPQYGFDEFEFTTSSNNAQCATVSNLEVRLVFTETNEKYMVNKGRKTSGTNLKYRIELFDDEFYNFESSINVHQGIANRTNGCYFTQGTDPVFGVSPKAINNSTIPPKLIEEQELDEKIGWSCFSVKQGILVQPSGCYPKRFDSIGS